MNGFPEGFCHIAGALDKTAQQSLTDRLRLLVAEAPLYRPCMPRTGRALSVRMTNLGELGWVADKAGYRYQPRHPVTNRPWPAMPGCLKELWRNITGGAADPQCCLVNYYDKDATMGLHVDRDEQDRSAPVVSISLGDTALFRIGGPERKGPTCSLKLNSGDVVVLAGEARHCYHGVSRVYHASSDLLAGGGRLNLTLRRVTPPATPPCP